MLPSPSIKCTAGLVTESRVRIAGGVAIERVITDRCVEGASFVAGEG